MKTILITGASRGIGLALAKIFLNNGFTVIGTCRSGFIQNFNQDNFNSLPLDLSDPDSITKFDKKIQDRNIDLDIIINNAGIGPRLRFRQTGNKFIQRDIRC